MWLTQFGFLSLFVFDSPSYYYDIAAQQEAAVAVPHAHGFGIIHYGRFRRYYYHSWAVSLLIAF